jgi:hypothetical protein
MTKGYFGKGCLLRCFCRGAPMNDKKTGINDPGYNPHNPPIFCRNENRGRRWDLMGEASTILWMLHPFYIKY